MTIAYKGIKRSLPLQKLVFLLGLMGTVLSLPHVQAEEPSLFKHPGLMHSQEEIAFVRAKLSENGEPKGAWKEAWEKLRSWRGSTLFYRPSAYEQVERGPYNRPDKGSSDFTRDGAAAYTHALLWHLTGKDAYGKKSVEIINAWSKKLKSVKGHDARLLIGMSGFFFCNAAELIRHADVRKKEIWPQEDQKLFAKMLRDVFYPVIEDFYPTANGNWDAAMMQTMMAMSIYLDDRKMFDRVVAYFRSGKSNGAIDKYFMASGQCQESGRDQAHTQMGLGYLACVCEMAWKQGVDLYSEADNRLAKGFEYTAKYNLGEEVEAVPYRSLEGRYYHEGISSRGRGRFHPIYEKVVLHYQGRKGKEMPYSQRVLDKVSPQRLHKQHLPWGALMFGALPLSTHEEK